MAAQRSPDSDVAGAAALNRDGPRYSQDIDLFHDRGEAVARAAEADAALLTQAGFAVHWLRREPGLHVAEVRRGEEATRLEWARDSDFRFFPAVRDELFGYRLHVADLATNKALAAASRREPRDVLDLLHVHERHLPLGPVIWAAVAKDPGYTPESLIGEIRRNARYRADDYADLQLTGPVDAADTARRLQDALDQADAFMRTMPAGREGLLFLRNGVPVQPDPGELASYTEHAGQRRGHWPASAEIASAMLNSGATGPQP
ncbi:MAG: hypothetical protein JO047_09150 [Alphaproteobacteria bacterium]|nr:hypothetical protein [Alphaproteobacteria bacterium]